MLLMLEIIFALHFLFVKEDASTYLSNARAAAKRIHTLRAALISSCGLNIDERYVVISPRLDDIDLGGDGDYEEA
jgi:hypothetical protein